MPLKWVNSKKGMSVKLIPHYKTNQKTILWAAPF